MMPIKLPAPSLCAMFCLLAGPVLAQTTHPNDVNIEGDLVIQVPLAVGQGGNPSEGSLYVEDLTVLDGKVCMGNSCSPGEVIPNETALRLNYTNNSIEFVDTSGASLPNRDWTLRVNDPNSGGIDRFSVEDNSAATTPFTIAGAVPNNAFWLATSGNLGLGTSIPQAKVHLVDIGNEAAIRMTRSGGSAHSWELTAADTFEIRDLTDNSSRLYINTDGFVGLGTDTPGELLHIRSNATNTDAFALFDANGAGSDAAFRLRQNGVTPTTWEFRNQQDSGRLNVGIAGGNTPLKIDNAANNNLIRLGRNGLPGEVNITGTLVVNNTQLNVPDYVFAHDYALRPLSEVQAFIDENSHLPDVPSEAEIKANGVDLTAMQMVHLKKIEELTLYTLEQQKEISEQTATIAALTTRLAKIEALLSE
ncbi:hypothetical protein ACFQFQ_06030 [Sulfitobacter porphyrae]|uniref:Peptidase S74 domain-containing protein n=1 Tax=Sulfitobacter porphyrae TaxID=1246864 RepID=A0ABW2B0U0_9RHOB